MVAKKRSQVKAEVFLVVDNYPEETKNIYVCGNCPELGDWDCKKSVKMMNNNKGEFELPLLMQRGLKIEYKYLSKPNWDGVECGIVATEVENRFFTTNCNKVVISQIKAFKSV